MHKRMCAYAYNTCSMYECMWTIQGLYAHNVFTYEIFNTIIALVQFQVFLCSDNGFIEIQMTNFPVVKLSYPWKATPDTDLLYRDDIILFTQNARCWYKTTFLRRYCLNKLKKWFRTSASTVIHSVSCSSWQTLAWWRQFTTKVVVLLNASALSGVLASGFLSYHLKCSAPERKTEAQGFLVKKPEEWCNDSSYQNDA